MPRVRSEFLCGSGSSAPRPPLWRWKRGGVTPTLRRATLGSRTQGPRGPRRGGEAEHLYQHRSSVGVHWCRVAAIRSSLARPSARTPRLVAADRRDRQQLGQPWASCFAPRSRAHADRAPSGRARATSTMPSTATTTAIATSGMKRRAASAEHSGCCVVLHTYHDAGAMPALPGLPSLAR